MLLLLFLSAVHTISFAGSIDLKEARNVKVYLNNISGTFVDKDRNFIFSDISMGNYLLTIPHNIYNFPRYEVTLSPQGTAVYELDDKGLLTPLTLPLHISPKSHKKYYDVQEPWAITDFFKSPYGILIPIGLCLLFFIKQMPSADSIQNAAKPRTSQT